LHQFEFHLKVLQRVAVHRSLKVLKRKGRRLPKQSKGSERLSTAWNEYAPFLVSDTSYILFAQLFSSVTGTALKELNPDVIGISASPNADVDEFDHRTEFPLSSSRTEAKRNVTVDIKQALSNERDRQMSAFIAENSRNGFRLSRHSDRHTPRTPSPMKAAYLRTGPSPASRMSGRAADHLKSPDDAHAGITFAPEVQYASPEPVVHRLSAQKQVDVNDFLLNTTVSSKHPLFCL